MTVSALRNMLQEDDFEFVPSHAHEHDDLSSITSNAGETDEESETHLDNSPSDSNVTLQMPRLDEASEHMERAESRMTHDELDKEEKEEEEETATSTTTKAVRFDVRGNETVELPILYIGPEEYKRKVLSKLADTLLTEFTADVWSSDCYTIRPDQSGSGAEIVKQSKLVLKVVALSDVLRSRLPPALIIRVLRPEEEVREFEYDRAGMSAFFMRKISCLTLLTPGFDVSTHSEMLRASFEGQPPIENQLLLTVDDTSRVGEAHVRALTLAEFQAYRPTELSTSLMNALDAWQEVKQSTIFSALSGKVSKLQAITVLTLLCTLLATYLGAGLVSPGGHVALPQNASSSISFHQLTETNALIQLPMIYRTTRARDTLDLVATVSRDGKLIRSHLDTTVDQLYSLAWSQSEAHGELLVAAQMTTKRASLKEAYVIKYSAKTPLLQAVAEKLRDLPNLGHLPEMDLSRRVQELVRQIENGRSFVVNASHHQVEYIKQHKGLKKIYGDSTEKMNVAGRNLRRLFDESHALGDRAMSHGARQVNNAQRGLKQLKKKFQGKLRASPSSWLHKLQSRPRKQKGK